ncbi:MAG: hypothetical protein IT254_01010 [Chitinophagaceae bacterium]|nr:hypothetical protein [Bacteroidota bacterium]MCC6256879.1 hypothetical protein [Chitinophagaceae bacterium]
MRKLNLIGITFSGLLAILIFSFATCKYSFNDVGSIPAEVKTFRVNYFENKAQYVNSYLSPNITEKLKQKIIGTTRLKQTNSDDAHYDISGYVSQYYATTIAVSGNNASGNRLTVGVHLKFRNTLDEKKNFETEVSSTFDFPASQTLNEVESTLNPEIVRNMVDQIFNKIFSNW